MKLRHVCVLCALAVSARGFASGIPVVDVAGLAQAVQQVTYLSQQLQTLQTQLQTTKNQLQKATDLNTYVTGNASYANLLDRSDLYNSLPSNLAGMYGGSVNAQALGLSSSNSIVNENGNVIASGMDSLDDLYADLRERTKNIENMKTVMNSTTTPTQRADLANRLSYEALLLQNDQNQIQTALKYTDLKQQQVSAKNANTFYASWMK